MAPINFLLIYDHEQQHLVETLNLGNRAEEAARTYAEYERRYRGQKSIEIVLVGADSLETIKRTHAHYFSDSAADPFATLVAGP